MGIQEEEVIESLISESSSQRISTQQPPAIPVFLPHGCYTVSPYLIIAIKDGTCDQLPDFINIMNHWFNDEWNHLINPAESLQAS